MKKDPKVFIGHILESIKRIKKDTERMSTKDFLEDVLVQDAVLRRLEIIGEAMKNIPDKFKEQYSSIPWQDIMDMRNKLIHEYFGVDLELVWEVVVKDIPTLKQELMKIK